MHPDLVEKWSRLEEAIQNIIDVFISRNIYLSNLDFRRNRQPHKYSYVNSFSTLDELRRRVMDSKHAFGNHIAFAPLLIAGTAPHTWYNTMSIIIDTRYHTTAMIK